jgi:prevent-host-death family protein
MAKKTDAVDAGAGRGRRGERVQASESEGVSLSVARDRLGELVNQTVYTKEPVFLSRRGKRVAAVIAADTLDRLIELAEDAIDATEAELARAEMEAGAEPVPWDEIKRDLGL